MKKKVTLGTSVILVVLVVSIISVVGPSFARDNNKKDYGVLNNYGTGSLVYLNSPNGTLSRPSIQLRCYDFNRHSAFGEFDAILVYVFSPVKNTYVMAALVTDLADPTIYQAIWNGTPIWLPNADPAKNFTNVVKVAPNELEIYTDSSKWENHRDTSNVLYANLTKAISVKNPDITFTIPAFSFMFRPISDDSYYSESANATLPSKYARQAIAEMRTPAWVEESVSSWFGAVSPQEVVGHIDYKYVEAINPPVV
jgi:hypothetical protein